MAVVLSDEQGMVEKWTTKRAKQESVCQHGERPAADIAAVHDPLLCKPLLYLVSCPATHKCPQFLAPEPSKACTLAAFFEKPVRHSLKHQSYKLIDYDISSHSFSNSERPEVSSRKREAPEVTPRRQE